MMSSESIMNNYITGRRYLTISGYMHETAIGTSTAIEIGRAVVFDSERKEVPMARCSSISLFDHINWRFFGVCFFLREYVLLL